jgi:hypothetical protein
VDTLDTPVVIHAGRPLQRAIVHEWQAAGYLLIAIGTILGVFVSLGYQGSAVGVALVLCLLLATPTALALLALHLRRYRLATALSVCGGGLCGLIALSSLSVLPDLLVGAGSVLDALGFLAIYAATMVPLAVAGTAGLKSGWDLGTVGRMEGRKHLSPRGGRPPLPAPPTLPGESPARTDEPAQSPGARYALLAGTGGMVGGGPRIVPAGREQSGAEGC